MKFIRGLFTVFCTVLFFACQQDDLITENIQEGMPDTKSMSINGGVKIAILSDTHVMDPSLLVSDGPAFQGYLAQDPKLIQYSSAILEATVNSLINMKPNLRPDLVLIAGDLTKDGELVSHQNVIRQLNKLRAKNIKVLVTIGNHDVNNPEAVQFDGAVTAPVATVQASDIPTLYARFGWGDAIARDPNSLSYVSEPMNGLWVITIDANRYYLNNTKSIGSGEIRLATMSWVKEQLAKAAIQKKTVIGMMHHGLVEHFNMEQILDYGYVLDNWQTAADELMDAGLKLILTGHYHANDITKRTHNGNFVFDVETGATTNYPCYYRMLTAKKDIFTFEPRTITNLMGNGFEAFAKGFQIDRLKAYFSVLLTMPPFNLDSGTSAYLAPFFTDAAMAHFAGDESPTEEVMGEISYINSLDPTGQLGGALGTLWTDINTPDKYVTINLNTGMAN
ncbi:metallophosphoesterase family protein [Bacteroides sedimenti]|uniref:Serine/threonine protein phosphatase n=1 Tax=Bacteroides sedimenti TaxID=2136147 RepID=A0ABN6YZX1_9BACE